MYLLFRHPPAYSVPILHRAGHVDLAVVLCTKGCVDAPELGLLEHSWRELTQRICR
jgi:hypothetical protein